MVWSSTEHKLVLAMCFSLFAGLMILWPPFLSTFADEPAPDVLSYQVSIEPGLEDQSIKGEVLISFLTREGQGKVVFDCGRLIVDELQGEAVQEHRQEDQFLIIKLSDTAPSEKTINIKYHGSPKRGVQFFPDIAQAYTVFFTSDWMICNKQPDDRATVSTTLIISDTLEAIANGTMDHKEMLPSGKMQYTWTQSVATPAYTYGFAIGVFTSFEEKKEGVQFRYLSHTHSSKELAQIFMETSTMLQFFQERSGVPYFQKQYTQILGQGRASQEMHGFSVIRNTYGQQVLDDSTQVNLAAHELAHQWWGNSVTCRSWRHFWLNEGMAVFMSSAYKEHRFGKEAYLEDIEVYRQAYQKVVDKGLDKPLVFKNWFNPSAEDRTLVYYKGAYVLHLLREELGELIFWAGIQAYTRDNYSSSVGTKDFQQAMETAAGRSLDAFFNTWVY